MRVNIKKVCIATTISLTSFILSCGLSEAQESAEDGRTSFLITLIQQSTVRGTCSISDGGDQSICIEYKGLSWEPEDVERVCESSGGVPSTHPDAVCSTEALQGTCSEVSRTLFYYTYVWTDDTSARDDCLNNQYGDGYNPDP